MAKPIVYNKVTDMISVPFKYREATYDVARKLDRNDQLFGYTDLEGNSFEWHIPTLETHIKSLGIPLSSIALTHDQIQHIITYNGVELEHLHRIIPSEATKPVLIVNWPDLTSTVVDGNHRLVWLYVNHVRTADAYMIDSEAARFAELDFTGPVVRL